MIFLCLRYKKIRFNLAVENETKTISDGPDEHQLHCFSVAEWLENGTSNAKVVSSNPGIAQKQLQCKSLWINVSKLLKKGERYLWTKWYIHI